MIDGSTHVVYETNSLQVSSGSQLYGVMERFGSLPSSNSASSISAAETNLHNLGYNLSLITDKVHQIETLINTMILSGSRLQDHSPGSSMALASMSNLIQDIMLTASSMMVSCQKLEEDSSNSNRRNVDVHQQAAKVCRAASADQTRLGVEGQVMQMGGDAVGVPFTSTDAYDGYFHMSSDNNHHSVERDLEKNIELASRDGLSMSNSNNSDVIELDAADLLAKYTHYCQVCGKGFKRDANLRMHMRAHGDEYKSNAALTNPMKRSNAPANNSSSSVQFMFQVVSQTRKYSCPQEGCRWNKKHAKFQPLKSMICVKNHYKRSHCPKMYVCNRCNHKQFSLLSDLRTHEKHCGDIKWQCSCGTTFSRKDKLMGHVALFLGHTPVANGCTVEQRRDNYFG